jgi:hypothetical protein
MKRIPLLLLAAGITFAYMSTVSIGLGQLQDSPWPMFHHDVKLTGRSPYEGALTPTLRWSYNTGSDVRSSPIIEKDGII